VALLDDLIERYGIDAILTVHPHMPGGEILRWELMIDGDYVPTADIRVSERAGHSVMLLTDAREEIELTRWREGPRGPQGPPASVVREARRDTAPQHEGLIRTRRLRRPG
jgi:hypothetical protein